MTKSAKHKKEVRKEKTKIKLKISQKETKRKKKGGLLPKGLNVTDTSFKSRKIIIHDNLRPVDTDVPTTVRKQTFKELLGHLSHFSTSVRQDGISGLKELFTKYPEILEGNLATVFDKVTQQVLDRDAELRKTSLKLLENTLKIVSEDQVSPFFPLMIAQLTCCMTHILPDIQQTSLGFLDALLASVPKLMSTVAMQVLPNFLEQISRGDGGSKKRVLTVDPSRKLTTLKWRQQVLERTSKLLELLVNDSTSNHENQTKEIVYNEGTCFAPVFSSYSSRLSLTIPAPGQTTRLDSREQSSIQNFVSTLIPLIMDTWIEALASEQLSEETEGSLVSLQTAELLSCIVNVLLLSLQLLEQQSTDRNNMIDWFKENYAEDLNRHFLQHFPYSSHLQSRKGKTKEKATDHECRNQNISLCFLWAELNLNNSNSFIKTLSSFLTSLIAAAHSTPLTSLEVDHLAVVLKAFLKLPSSSSLANRIFQSITDFVKKVRSSRKDRLHLARSMINLVLELPTETLEKVAPLKSWVQHCPQLLQDSDTTTLKSINALLSRRTADPLQVHGTRETLKLLQNLSDFNKNPAFLKELINLVYWTCSSRDSPEKKEIISLLTNSAELLPAEVKCYAEGVLQLL